MSPVIDIIIQATWAGETDILLLQELWASRNYNGWLTKIHPGVNRTLPANTGNTPEIPRAIIIFRKEKNLLQNFSCGICSDLTCSTINGAKFVSNYWATNTEIAPLLSWTPDERTVVGENFSAAHTECQSQTKYCHRDGKVILE